MELLSFKPFLINYIGSLLERTRLEKSDLKMGFDWLIYQICLIKGYSPVRLPFIRQSDSIAAKTKTEAEFGIDMSFLSQSEDELFIFVLKDEVLNNKNWTAHNFDSDIRMAASPDMQIQDLEKVKTVNVILTYNKDEDSNGIELFNRLINNLPKKINDQIELKFIRWNLTRIVDEVVGHLLTPEIMPQHLYGTFLYICSQYNDFNFSSEEWNNQLIPNWKNFLKIALSGKLDDRKVNLIPVTLIILLKYKKDEQISYAGWIDLIEWAMLELWQSIQSDKIFEDKVINIWLQFYINELEKYHIKYHKLYITQHGFSSDGSFFSVSAINHAYRIFWHIGRLGIFTMAPMEFMVGDEKKYKELILTVLNRSSEWLTQCLHLNPASLRPLIDLHHVELFLIWFILYQSGNIKEIQLWLSELESRLLVRRFDKNVDIPFVESRSNMDALIEYVVSGERPYNFSDRSSYLLLMIMELCFSLDEPVRSDLMNRYYTRIVKGLGSDGKKLSDVDEIDLVSWVPPDDWGNRVIKNSVKDGIAISTLNFNKISGEDVSINEAIFDLIDKMRKQFPWEDMSGLPLSVKILGCIKNNSPLPPEIWRDMIPALKEKKDSK